MRKPSDGGTITASSAVRSDPHPGSGPTLPHSLGCTLANHGANFRRNTTRIALGAECCCYTTFDSRRSVHSLSGLRVLNLEITPRPPSPLLPATRDTGGHRYGGVRGVSPVGLSAQPEARMPPRPGSGEGREGFGGHHARPEPCRTVPCGCWPPQWERRVALGVKLLLLVPCAGRAARPRGGAGAAPEGVGYGWGSEPRGWQAPEARGCCVLVFRS